MLIPLGVGVAAGLVNGIVIAYGNVVAFMATLAMLVAARGLAELISGRRTQIVIETGFLQFTRSSIIGVPLLIWIFLVVAIVAWFLLNAPHSAAAPSRSAATGRPRDWPASG